MYDYIFNIGYIIAFSIGYIYPNTVKIFTVFYAILLIYSKIIESTIIYDINNNKFDNANNTIFNEEQSIVLDFLIKKRYKSVYY